MEVTWSILVHASVKPHTLGTQALVRMSEVPEVHELRPRVHVKGATTALQDEQRHRATIHESNDRGIHPTYLPRRLFFIEQTTHPLFPLSCYLSV